MWYTLSTKLVKVEETAMYRTITLSNGARLLTEYIPGARPPPSDFFVGAGSRHERATENGAAHFIEHLSFKGTDRRSAADLAREIDAIGGQVNAYTTKESTCYYARCLTAIWTGPPTCCAICCSTPASPREDVELERGVILRRLGCTRTPRRTCAPTGWLWRSIRAAPGPPHPGPILHFE